MKQDGPEVIGCAPRAFLLLGAWGVAYFITMLGIGPGAIAFLPWFPIGLYDLVGGKAKEAGLLFICFGWMALLALHLAVLGLRRERTLIVTWLVLLLLLVATAVGCHTSFDHARDSMSKGSL